VKDEEKATWLLVLSMERAIYLHAFELGKLDGPPFYALEHFMAAVLADAHEAETKELSALYDSHFDVLLAKMERMPWSCAYEAGLAYMDAQHEIEHLTLPHGDNAGGKGQQDTRELHRVRQEKVDNLENMSKKLKALRKQAPKAITAFQERYVATELLRRQRSFVETMLHEGELADLDAAPLLQGIDSELAVLLLDRSPITRMRKKIAQRYKRVMPTEADGDGAPSPASAAQAGISLTPVEPIDPQ